MNEISGQLTNEARVPVYAWIEPWEIEEGAKAQLRDAITHPRVTGHVAVFPDIHQGYGIPVGTAFMTDQVVVPNAVGVDIGCGVSALRIESMPGDVADREFWQAWAERVRARIPVGFSWHDRKQRWDGFSTEISAPLDKDVHFRAAQQLGTLGGGNHFLEAAVDQNDAAWLMVHSGSRGIGNKIAWRYHEDAKHLRRLTDSTEAEGLAFLPVERTVGQAYLRDMQWAMGYAAESRRRMLSILVEELAADVGQTIDTPHNAAWMDEQGRVLHRKGSTPARAGDLAVIPGSMGAPSFIVQGIGNALAHDSCSHGAGRRMSRGDAKRQFDLDTIASQLSETFTEPSIGMADEAPGAYKEIERGIELQAGLIEVVHRLRPIITIKGDARARDD